MKKGQVYEATVERVDFPNKGIAGVGEDTVIVKNSLPGQKVKFQVNKVRKGKAEGRLLEVLEKSPLETGSPCSHFGVCGGCTYISLPYKEQLRIKEEQVKRLLDGVLGRQEDTWLWEGIKGSPAAYEYRNKMEFSFGDEVKDGPLSLGMHKRGSFYDVVTVEDCQIVDADYRLILKAVRDYFAELGTSYYHRIRHTGYLRHLLVRKAVRTGEILVALVTTSQWENGDGATANGGSACCEEAVEVSAEDDLKGNACHEMEQVCRAGCNGRAEYEVLQGFLSTLLELENNGRLQGRFAGILHIVNDSQADVVQSDRTEILYGRDYFYEELLGLRFRISPFSFFQTNSLGAEVLYETARSYIGDTKDKVIFDLYSGTGTIAQMLAPVAERVVGVEIVEEAVEAAKVNARLNGLANCSFIAGDVLKVVDELEEKPDLIVLDPPRDGVHPKALQRIIDFGVERIVYISCKPTSLVRDLELLQGRGYRVEKAVGVDLFPFTVHVETIVLIQKKTS